MGKTGFLDHRGELRERVRSASRSARLAGALQPIATSFEIVPDGGVEFLIRVVEPLAAKGLADATSPDPGNGNPFVHYQPELLVAQLSETHIGLLNKYHVVDDHLLIVTREFQSQEQPLDRSDFEALWYCLAEYDALGFYNAGRVAGASQPHKHLQLVPLPLIPESNDLKIPIETIIDRSRLPEHHVATVPNMPFCHRLVRWTTLESSPLAAAERCWKYYRDMLVQLGRVDEGATLADRPSPYNLLVTRRWMLMVPRQNECSAGVSLNALAFAGALLVPDVMSLNRLVTEGPCRALCHAAGSA